MMWMNLNDYNDQQQTKRIIRICNFLSIFFFLINDIDIVSKPKKCENIHVFKTLVLECQTT